MSIDDEELHWQQKIDEALGHAAGWLPFMQSPPRVEPGSALAGDDARYGLMTTSTLALNGILAAVEHLYATERLWVATDGATMPSAYGSLLRPAAIGAARAHWLLFPSRRDVRENRTLLLARDETRNACNLAKETRDLDGISVPDRAGAAESTEKLIKRYGERLKTIDKRLDRPGFTKDFRLTDVFATVARDVHTDSPLLDMGIRMLWRQASGDSHAMLWPRTARGVKGKTIDLEDGTALLRDTLSYGELWWMVGSVIQMTAASRQLFELRRTKHH